MNKLEITERHIYRFRKGENKLASKHSGKKFCANGIRLRIQFRSFVLNPQHFIDQTIEFATAFL